MAVTADPPVRTRDRGGRDSLRLTGLLLALVLLGVVVVASLAFGAKFIPFGESWRLWWDNDGSSNAAIIHDLRLPRTMVGLMVGAALGLSGALMQALTLNPLAEPGLLGVNLGAATGVVLAIAFFGITTISGYVWFAFAGAALTSVVVFLLGNTGRSATPDRQILAGIAITTVMGSGIYAILVLRPEVFNKYRFWEVGSLGDVSVSAGWRVAPFVAIGIGLALALGPALNALAMGEETGRALGAHVMRTRLLGMLAVTLLCGGATAVVGPIYFVGLAVPHMTRMFTGPDQRWILLYSMVLAPVLLLLADIIGRVITAPSELQVGIVTAFVGAPVFIVLARRRRLAQL
ncbi:FecCD family ABC transporter permease [Kineosporia babensis]|uniref:Iron chelate uptake ABC transporter family permease subunit n=1 Tax=Kineosporia babensis TaxID=499548 RepID=A0A9X1NAI0_9ACTN|nr:iron chelate uptake ABC transporter family permease subunit [Kineosporia babensis]MCD5310231.1 iron chelate uptake ABC transporter family permease subunit [Kineosporia babensis]